jgi:DNA replication protein DnaC
MRKLKFEKELIKNSERNKTLKKITEILNNNHTSGLYIFGKSQTGKTYFFILLVNLLVEKNYTVVFLDLTRFLTQLKSEMSENVKTQKLVYKTINCDILFIDDLGNELITP